MCKYWVNAKKKNEDEEQSLYLSGFNYLKWDALMYLYVCENEEM